MSWFADLAGRAESLLNNLDEQTGAVLRNQNGVKLKKHEYQDAAWQKRRPNSRAPKKNVPMPETKSYFTPTTKSSPAKSINRPPTKESLESVIVQERIRRKSPLRKQPQYSLNNSPKTLVNDDGLVEDGDMADHFGLRQRSE